MPPKKEYQPYKYTLTYCLTVVSPGAANELNNAVPADGLRSSVKSKLQGRRKETAAVHSEN